MEEEFKKNDVEVEMLHIGSKNIRGCIACHRCAGMPKTEDHAGTQYRKNVYRRLVTNAVDTVSP